jgi:hypothetical protein
MVLIVVLFLDGRRQSTTYHPHLWNLLGHCFVVDTLIDGVGERSEDTNIMLSVDGNSI